VPVPGGGGGVDLSGRVAVEARGVLQAAAVGRQAQLWYGGLSRDSYERALAHVIGDRASVSVATLINKAGFILRRMARLLR